MPLAEQLEHHWSVNPGPLVLGTALLKYPTPTVDRDRQLCYFRHSHGYVPEYVLLRRSNISV